MTTAQTADVKAWQAYQRDKAKAEKAAAAMAEASPEEMEAFQAWQEQKDTKDQPAPAPSGTGLTDAILAERISHQVLADKYVWSAGLGWMRWTGVRWERSNPQTVIETIRQHLVARVTAQLREPDTDWNKRQELMSLLGKTRITAVTELSKGVVQVRDDMFDARPDLLNTPSGVVHLGTGQMRPHDPKLYLTKVTAVHYRPDATHPDWDQALEAIREDARPWFQNRAGQGITGHMTPDDVMVFLQGGGENGKSTVLDSIRYTLGEYEVFLSDRVLLADPGSHPTELMSLRGARFAVAEELPEDHKLNVKRLKDTVGTSTMKARYIRQDEVQWKATHSMFISTNYLPVINETDHGTWRRLMLLKFPYRYVKPGQPLTGPDDRQGDPGLRQRMKTGREQQEAVLSWLVAGARRWYANNRVMPAPPDTVTADTRAWRAESDLVLSYWDDRIEDDPDSHVMARELFDDFNSWLSTKGHRPWSDKTFNARFGAHEETTQRGGERKKIRARDGLSRPPGTYASLVAPTVPTVYWAWLGIGFVKDGMKADDADE